MYLPENWVSLKDLQNNTFSIFSINITSFLWYFIDFMGLKVLEPWYLPLCSGKGQICYDINFWEGHLERDLTVQWIRTSFKAQVNSHIRIEEIATNC